MVVGILNTDNKWLSTNIKEIVMNREQKRDFVKMAKKNGFTKEKADAFIHIGENGSGKTSSSQEINRGDKVRLNTEYLMSRDNYNITAESYRKFVEENPDTVFKVVSSFKNLVTLEEEPKWLFWSGDLIVVERAVTE